MKATQPIGGGAAMREVLAAAADVAATNATVLLCGESGTGKEVLARFIHAHSPRSRGPYVAVNCAAVPADLLESELFGHERGAFTGASERRIGKVELAGGGTLLLDEVSEMPAALQAKLLRVLQEREVDRVGGRAPIPVDVRVIATTNRDLEAQVREGAFREDLYYRLAVFPIALPPLRERREDIPALAKFLVARAAEELGRPALELAPDALEALGRRPFPGNVRELGNVLARALVRARGPALGASDLSPPPAAPGPFGTEGFPLDLAELEQLAIAEALRRTGGNRTHAAKLLGIGLRTLRAKLNDRDSRGHLRLVESA